MAPSSEPRDVVMRFLEHGFRDGEWNMEVIDECFDERYWSHTWQGDLAHTGARQGRFLAGLQTVERISDDLVAERDLVVHRSTRRMRHVGEIFGVPATGREMTVEGVEMWRVTDGKIVEHWGGLGAGAQLYRAITVPSEG
ncbi:MAG TPA: ester cyclase [Acidimicrobiales bacterium]|nr:ester cyclase [Acidimicrobiales bacterium]